MDEHAAGRLPLGALFLIAFAFLVLLWHPGRYSNDEVGQAAGLHSLAEGRLGVRLDELDPGFAQHLRGVAWHFAIPKEPFVAYGPFDSVLLSVMALPPLFVLRALEWAVGYHVGLAVAQSALMGVGAGHLGQLLGAARPRLWAWLPALVVVPGAALRTKDWPSAPYLEFAALQLVNMAMVAFAAVLLFDLMRRRLPERRALAVAAIFLLATPVLFWSQLGKDHALSMSLVAVAMWCYRDGHRTPPLRTFLAFACAGLFFWHHSRMGIFLAATLALLAMPAVRLGVRAAGARAGAAILGLVPGLALDTWQRVLHARIGLFGTWGDVGWPVQDLHEEVATDARFLQHVDAAGLLSRSVFFDPGGVLETMRAAFLWSDHFFLAFAVLLPPLAAIPYIAARPELRSQWHRPLAAFSAVYTALYVGIVGEVLLSSRVSFDMRYLVILWPGALLLAAPGLAQAMEGVRRFADIAVGAGIAFLALSLCIIFVGHAAFGLLTPEGNIFDEVLPMRSAGLGLAVGTFVASMAALASRAFVPAWSRFMAAGVGLAVQFQLFLVLGMVRPSPRINAPFVAWPVDLLGKAVWWLVHWP